MASQTCLPTTAWFLVNEAGGPAGQIRRPDLPEAGANFAVEGKFDDAQIVEFTELRPSCSMRRFRVIIKIIR